MNSSQLGAFDGNAICNRRGNTSPAVPCSDHVHASPFGHGYYRFGLLICHLLDRQEWTRVPTVTDVR